jgi:trimethylamine--corrinoid protein Co-methyltransferase
MQPQINFISPEEQEHIHKSALRLLENVGMQMPAREAVDIMRGAGAKIEGENIVKIPEELATDAVAKAPKRDDFVLYGRKKKHDIHFNRDAPVLTSMEEATHVLDLETKERRPCTNKDLADIVRLIDALDNIRINAALATPQDVPKHTCEWYALATVLKNTSKHITVDAPGAQFVRDAVKMASLSVGSEENLRERPFITFVILTRPPFQIDRLSLEALIEMSRQGFPIKLSSGPILGMTSPVTIAGTLAQVHAEFLSCLVLSQIVRPGTPVMYTSFARGFDMKTVNVSMASPEFAIMRGAIAQMAHYLDLPARTPGFLRDAKVLDAQAGFESGTVGLVAAMAADVMDGLQYDMDTLVDFADIVFCDEAWGALKRIARGFSIDENGMALDTIKEVGHGGSFLGTQHTLKNFRDELWTPHLMERRSWAQWEKDGKKDTEQRAREKAKEILASHQTQQLSPEVEAKIDRIAQEATIDYAESI